MNKPFLFIILLVVVVNGVWYLIKVILKKNGYPVNWFFFHFKDIPNMYRLAKVTTDRNEKMKYYTLLAILCLGLVFLPILFLLFSGKF